METIASLKLHPSFEDLEREQRFWNDNYDRLIREYPDHYVAVLLGDWSVVATNPELTGILSDLRTKGVALEDVSVQFVSETMKSLIL